MDETGVPHADLVRHLRKAREKDMRFSEGRVLGSMYTEPLGVAKEAHTMFWEANLGNPGLYPGTAGMERDVIAMLGSLLRGPGAAGHVTSGGTEANITALWVARNITGNRDVLIPKSAHVSLYKAADLLGLNAVEVGLDDGFRMDLGDLEDGLRRSEPAAVVAVAGTTELGMVDPVEKIAGLCSDDGVPLHVDAAFGGMVLPFLEDVPDFDFSIGAVSSITVDPHKMGFSTSPAGAVLFRDGGHLERISHVSPYLTRERNPSLLGTRCSAAVASAYAAMKYLGREGYRRKVAGCMENTRYLVSAGREKGFKPVISPVINIVGLGVPDPERAVKSLRERGWRASVGRNPPCLRVVVMPHVTREVIDAFLSELEGVLGD